MFMMMLHILKFHINGKDKNLNFPIVKKFIAPFLQLRKPLLVTFNDLFKLFSLILFYNLLIQIGIINHSITCSKFCAGK